MKALSGPWNEFLSGSAACGEINFFVSAQSLVCVTHIHSGLKQASHICIFGPGLMIACTYSDFDSLIYEGKH